MMRAPNLGRALRWNRGGRSKTAPYKPRLEIEGRRPNTGHRNESTRQKRTVHRSVGEQRKISKTIRSRSENARQVETGRHKPKNMIRSISTTNGIQKSIFSFKSNEITLNSQSLLSVLRHLIHGIKIEFVTHFYSRNIK
jgi:hypothetical protein